MPAGGVNGVGFAVMFSLLRKEASQEREREIEKRRAAEFHFLSQDRNEERIILGLRRRIAHAATE
jgi:hypothetical protein